MGQIIEREHIKGYAQIERACGMRIAFTNGCFDILHLGHVRTLEWARARADVLLVGVNSSPSVRRLKGNGRPVVPQAERVAIVAALACVDRACLFDEDDPEALIREIKPDILVKGEDWKDKLVAGAEYAGAVMFAPLVPCLSTTLKLQDCAQAWRTTHRPSLIQRLVAGTIGRLLPGGREW
jgi:D-beta-D-heptose 7-phosphate kinase/D-beta-D-heptose 1-phosphate adenosyltransferase